MTEPVFVEQQTLRSEQHGVGGTGAKPIAQKLSGFGVGRTSMQSGQRDQCVDHFHGVEVADPCRWLEDASSPDVRAWTERQRLIFRSYVDAIPDRSRISSRVEELLCVDTHELPWHVGSKLFYLKRSAYQEQACLTMSEGGIETVLIDPNNRQGSAQTVQILQVSDDGNLLAYGEKTGGEDTCTVGFFDVAKRERLPWRLSRGFHSGLAFAPGGNEVFHAHERIDDERGVHCAVYKLNLLTGEEEEIFFAGKESRLRLRIIPGYDSGWLLYSAHSPESGAHVYLHNATDSAPSRQIYHPDFGEFSFLRVGSRCWAMNRRPDGPRQIISFDACRPEPEYWDVILLDVSDEAANCSIWQDHICVTVTASAGTVTHVYSLTGEKTDEINYPQGGTVGIFAQRTPAQSGIYYRYSSFSTPPTICRYDLDRRLHSTLFTRVVPDSPTHIETHQDYFQSADGTHVPITIAWDPTSDPPSPGPTILTAYGGFGGKLTPENSPFYTFLFQQGFRVAFASVRGGSELGADWYEAGRQRNKPNSVMDFIAAAEWLITNNHTTSAQLAFIGGSSSGLIVAAAMMKRPDLCRVVICMLALLDMIRYHKFDRTYRWIPEYGCADDPEDFKVLLSYSPYHAIRNNVTYPSVLFVTGEADDRINPLHIRKTTHLLQLENGGPNPVLADISPLRGHSLSLPLTDRIRALTDKLAFLCGELGAEVRHKRRPGSDEMRSTPLGGYPV